MLRRCCQRGRAGGGGRRRKVGIMAHDRSGIAVRVCISLLGMLFVASHMAAQSDTTVPSKEQQKAEGEYVETLGRVQHGDMSVDFRAFRVAGALKSGPHASKLETEERAAFRNIMASGDWTGALDSAKRALERNYASPIAQYDAMAAYQAMGRADEAAAHEKILNALLDSIRQSGDGKSPETAYFVVTVQEEYIFLNRVLNVRAKSQDWVRKDGHFYDRLAVPDSTTNQVGYLWFNADFDARSDLAAIATVKDGVLATRTAIRPGDSSAFQTVVPDVPSQSGMATHPDGYVRISRMQVRVRNGSNVDFKGVEVGGKKYGDIKADATSDYQEVWELASRYAAVSFVVGSQPVTIRPDGEQTSGGGLFHLTYLLTSRGNQWTIALVEESVATLPEGADVPPQPKSAYISPHPAAYESTDSNLRVPPNTTILDNFDGASAGRASGVQYVQIPGAQPNRRGASLSRKSDSRIEYPQGIPSEGTLEWWINVASGYFYQDFQLHTNQEQALIFSTDAQGGDVTWPGTAKLVVSVYGDVSFFLAANKFNQPAVQPMEPRGTPFRFNSWHAIGVSYGSQGEFIMVDGKVMGSAPKRTQTLGAAGNRTEPLDVPTIGQTVSHFWASHRYDGGFEGTVALFRASSAQKDWYLARGVAADFRPPHFGSANQPVAQATPSAIPVPPDAGSTEQGTPVSSRVGPEAGPANSPRGASLGPGQPAEGLLQNGDVIKMVKAGFDDALIIEKVGNSKCQFETSADALTQLKQSGASGPVVRAVMEASAPRGLALTGRVVWNGLPVPNAKVRLAHRDSVSAPASARAVTAHDGAFTIQDPPVGDLMIWVYAPSSEYTDLIGRAVTITAGNPENIGNVSITKKLQLLSPTISEIATTTPALEWARFPDSVRYNVYVFNDSTRQRILLRSTKDTRMTVPAPLPSGQQLRWGAQAYNPKGEEIAVAWWRFTVASPNSAGNTSPDPHEPATLTPGPNARTQVTGRVAWNGIPVPNVQVQIKQDTGDSSRPVLASTVSAADGTFTIQEPPIGSLMIYALAPSTDYWSQTGRLITVMADQPNNVGDVPLEKKLQLLSPTNGAVVTTTTPTLQWTAFPGTARYDVYVFNNTTHQRVSSQSTQSTQIAVSPALQSGQQYQWSVHAYNASRQQVAYLVRMVLHDTRNEIRAFRGHPAGDRGFLEGREAVRLVRRADPGVSHEVPLGELLG